VTGIPAGPVRALSIAGSDPSGGAGIQADLKTFAALGAYGMAAITSLTAQNTRGVTAVHVPPAAFLIQQLDTLAADVAIDAVKIGMLANEENALAVAEWLAGHPLPVVVLDPVMVATSGDRLLDPDAVEAVRKVLLPLAGLVTPNVPELAVLVGAEPATSWPEALDQGRRLAAGTGVAVLVKGGHLGGDRSPDALVEPGGRTVTELDAVRVDTPNTHGTGCSLSSALAALLPRSADPVTAARTAKAWLTGALQHSAELRVGTGAGPVHHFHQLWPLLDVEQQPFTGRMWAATAELRAAIDDLAFLRGLTDGTLDAARFAHYLQQDAIYLAGYSRALARCSELAPGREQQLFWAQGAHTALAVEAAMHADWLAGAGVRGPAVASVSTTGYLDHLAAVGARGDYAELVAAVLPCYWVYADVGERLLAEASAPDHPYRRWIDTYADPEFAEATRWVRAEADRCAADAGGEQLRRMRAAFERSVRFEWMFWDAAWRLEGWPV